MPKIMHAYAEAFDAGLVHCIEVYNEANELVGDGYGVALDGVFIIESQFSRDASASKVGFSMLNWHLSNWGYAFSDNKRMTPAVADMGFRDVPRRISCPPGAAGSAARQERALASRGRSRDGRGLAAWRH
jgi:leucyl/phenylalanyl-tRNA--protein transferase